MLDTSQSWYSAITADSRRVLLRIVVDISDPDLAYGDVDSTSAAPYSQPAQLHDKIFTLSPPYATLEPNRWLLNGQFQLLPDNMQPSGEVGFVGGDISAEDGTFPVEQTVTENVSNLDVLQSMTIFFPNAAYDGVADTFTVSVLQGGTAYFTQSFTGNTSSQILLEGFTVNTPDAVTIAVSKWSLPGRAVRIPEIILGVYEEWDGSMLAEFDVKQQANFSCLALPYGTCTLSMDNLDRRFEPRNKDGIFRSIEERQGISVSIGALMPDGSTVFQPIGVFYQFDTGWKTSDNGITMQWSLVDIIGLLSNRQYLPPSTLPTTLSSWAASLVGQLGANFASAYIVDPNYASLPLTAATADVSGKSCGEILRMICMATGTFPRADAATGKLAIEPLWDAGTKITLDNIINYPTMQANDDIAALIFTLNDGNNTQYVVSGNSTASGNTVQIQNPFIQTQAQALTAARLILSTYGGNQLTVVGRGNPASEIGDVDTVWLDESSATTGRRMYQTFAFSDGVLQGCQTTLLQADGSFMFQTRVVFTSSGSWTAPAGVTQLRIICVGKGQDGGNGTDGSFSAAGVDGADGSGGLVWAGTVTINAGQNFTITIDDNSVFGAYSSANGEVYEYGYTDIASGDSFARTGVADPLPGSGDGGAGGVGGSQGIRHREQGYNQNGDPVSYWETDAEPGQGTDGAPGALGCVVVYYDSEEV